MERYPAGDPSQGVEMMPMRTATGIDSGSAGGGGAARSSPGVDLNFPAGVRLDYGNVTVLQPVPDSDIDERLRTGVTVASPGSCFVRGLLVGLSIITPPFGWISMCAKMKYVKVDQVSLAKGCDGTVYVLPRGCHLATTYCRQIKDFNITNNVISINPVNLIRILPGTWGIAEINGEPVIMAPGRHFINDPLFKFLKPVGMTDNYVLNRTVHIITVAEGQLALVECLGVGHILEPGAQVAGRFCSKVFFPRRP